VLRARVVELDQNGNAKDVWVYAGGRRIYANGSFEHHNPVTGSYVRTLAHPLNRLAIRQERDPADAELPLEAPVSGGSYVSSKWDQPLFIDGGDPFDFSGGCTQDGIAISCNEAQHNLDRGTAVAALSIGALQVGYWDFTGRGEMGMNFLRSGARSIRVGTWVEDEGEIKPDGPDGVADDGTPILRSTGNSDGLGHWEYSWIGLAFGGQRGSKTCGGPQNSFDDSPQKRSDTSGDKDIHPPNIPVSDGLQQLRIQNAFEDCIHDAFSKASIMPTVKGIGGVLLFSAGMYIAVRGLPTIGAIGLNAAAASAMRGKSPLEIVDELKAGGMVALAPVLLGVELMSESSKEGKKEAKALDDRIKACEHKYPTADHPPFYEDH
jgi:hypothetical protein